MQMSCIYYGEAVRSVKHSKTHAFKPRRVDIKSSFLDVFIKRQWKSATFLPSFVHVIFTPRRAHVLAGNLAPIPRRSSAFRSMPALTCFVASRLLIIPVCGTRKNERLRTDRYPLGKCLDHDGREKGGENTSRRPPDGL